MHRTAIKLLNKELRLPQTATNYPAIKEAADYALSLLKLNEKLFESNQRNHDKLWRENTQLFHDLKLVSVELLRLQKIVAALPANALLLSPGKEIIPARLTALLDYLAKNSYYNVYEYESSLPEPKADL